MAAEAYVRGVSIDEQRICVPRISEDPDNCARHGHVPGRRRLVLDLSVMSRSDEDEEAWWALVGKMVQVTAAQNAG